MNGTRIRAGGARTSRGSRRRRLSQPVRTAVFLRRSCRDADQLRHHSPQQRGRSSVVRLAHPVFDGRRLYNRRRGPRVRPHLDDVQHRGPDSGRAIRAGRADAREDLPNWRLLCGVDRLSARRFRYGRSILRQLEGAQRRQPAALRIDELFGVARARHGDCRPLQFRHRRCHDRPPDAAHAGTGLAALEASCAHGAFQGGAARPSEW